MCIICVEFNKNKDLEDARRMLEAARRESHTISEKHLEKIEDELKQMNQDGKIHKLDDEEGN